MVRSMVRWMSHSMLRSAFGPALGTAVGTTVLAAGLLSGGSGGGPGRLRSAHATFTTPLATSLDTPLDSTTTRFPTRLDGAYWTRLTPAEQQIYLQGFVAGAAAEQAGSHGPPADSLREGHLLHFPFGPTVYAAQLNDFYWWQNHAAMPIADAMRQINGTR
jgi:hypothetical protein